MRFYITAGSQKPYIHTSGGDNLNVIYFQTPGLKDGNHQIDITVTTANRTNPYIVDCFLITPTADESRSGVDMSYSTPSSTPTSSNLPIVTTQSTPVGAIVGGVVGGIAGIIILVVALWYFLRRRKSHGTQPYYFENPGPRDMLADECLYTSNCYLAKNVEGLPVSSSRLY